MYVSAYGFLFLCMNLPSSVYGTVNMQFQLTNLIVVVLSAYFFLSEIWFLQSTQYIGLQVHVVDGSSLQPDLEFDAVRLELKLFNPELSEKPYIVAYNKMDLPEAYENWESFKEKMQSRGITPFCMSAVKGEGTHEVICAAYEILRKSKKDEEEYEGCNLLYAYSIYYCPIIRTVISIK